MLKSIYIHNYAIITDLSVDFGEGFSVMTGETGAYGGFRKGTKMKLPQKWLNLFAGPENEKYGTRYCTAPFRVSR